MEFEQLPPLFVRMFIRQIKLLNFIGIDIFNEYNYNPLQRYGRLTICSGFITCLVFGQVMYVIKGKKIGANFLDVVDAVPAIFIIIQICVKMYVFILKKKQIQEIIIEIGKEWPECSDAETSKELEEWTQKLHFFYNVFFRTAVFAMFFFTTSPMLLTIYKFYTEVDAKYQLIVQVYYLCELDSHFKYAIVYMHQMITCLTSNLCLYITCDFILVDLIFALSSLLALVQINLRNLKVPFIRGNYEDNCNDIKNIVKTHQNLLRLAENLNIIFGPLLFIQMSISSIVISCYGFMAFVTDGMFIRNVTSTFAIIFAIFVLAWPGQLLIDASSGVAEAAYGCRWYERSNKFRKYISKIIIRSQKPCHLNALGFSNLSLAMFSKVIRTAWSYLFLLHQMYEVFDL